MAESSVAGAVSDLATKVGELATGATGATSAENGMFSQLK
jgi:hypothetical protein